MTISQAQYVDLLFKNLQGVAKTANAATKSASNESIASPAFLRGDIVWTQSNQIPSSAAVVSGVTQAYLTTNRIQCTVDNSVPLIPPLTGVGQTWLTGLSYWVPAEFGSTWGVKVWIDNTGASDPTTTGTQIFSTGIGGVGEFYFDCQAGVLNFIGETVPAALTTGKSIFITGYRYVGLLGVTNLASLSVTGNITAGNVIGNMVVSSFSTTGNVTGGNLLTGGLVSATGNVTGSSLLGSVVSVTGNITGSYFSGNGTQLAGVLADRGADTNNWNTLTIMGIYTVNRTSWTGTVGTPLDSQVYVGMLEVKNSTNTAIEQIFYPGNVETGDEKIQWNRANWSGTWTHWIKIVNDYQTIVAGDF